MQSAVLLLLLGGGLSGRLPLLLVWRVRERGTRRRRRTRQRWSAAAVRRRGSSTAARGGSRVLSRGCGCRATQDLRIAGRGLLINCCFANLCNHAPQLYSAPLLVISIFVSGLQMQ